MRKGLRWLGLSFAVVEVALIALLIWILKANEQSPAPEWATMSLWGLVGLSFLLGFCLLLRGGQK